MSDDPNSGNCQTEFERKFLVTDRSVLEGSTGDVIVQGYIWSRAGYAIRVRRRTYFDGDGLSHATPGTLTLKGPRMGDSRLEIESVIPVEHVDALLDLSDSTITKYRHSIISEGNAWDVDVFQNENEGLVVAEFEGSQEEVARLKKPWWCGLEVTGDSRYQNENLADTPFQSW